MSNTDRINSIIEALRRLGGQALPAEIAAEIRRYEPGPFPRTLLNSVRGRIQECSSDSTIFKGKRDLFYSVYGIGGGVWGLRDMDPLNLSNDQGFADEVETYLAAEGRAILRTHLRRERSKKLVRLFKSRLENYLCTICEFDFYSAYGELGKGYIEAHHIVHVSKLEAGTETKIEDLAAVCANCHRMLHRSDGISIEGLKAKFKARI